MQLMKVLLGKCLVLVVAVVSVALRVDRNCTTQPVKLKDIQDAMLATEAVQKDDIIEGSIIGDTGYKVTKVVTKYLKDSSGTELRALIAKRDTFRGKTSIIAYRGIDEFKVLGQFKSDLEDYGETEVFFGSNRTSVNKYIWLSFSKLYYHIEKYLYHPDRRYIYTGHSAGGAMASLLALMTKSRRKGIPWDHPGTCLISFGAPRVGDKAFADRHDELISPTRKLRFVNRYDIVPHIPTSSVYQHHSREIWINKEESPISSKDDGLIENEKRLSYWKICSEGEPTYCSNQINLLRLSPSDHNIERYMRNILNPPSKYYTTSDPISFVSWSSAFQKSCSGIEKEVSSSSLSIAEKENEEESLFNGNHPTDSLRKSPGYWAQSLKSLSTKLHHGKISNEKANASFKPDVLYTFNNLPTSLSQRITPVSTDETTKVPKVIYLKHTEKGHQKIVRNANNEVDTASSKIADPKLHIPQVTDSAASTTPKISNKPQASLLTANPPLLDSTRIEKVANLSAVHPNPQVKEIEKQNNVNSIHQTFEKDIKPPTLPTSDQSALPFTVTHMVQLTQTKGTEPIPVTHIVHNRKEAKLGEGTLRASTTSTQESDMASVAHELSNSLAQITPEDDRMQIVSASQAAEIIPVTHMVHLSSSEGSEPQPIPVTHVTHEHRMQNADSLDILEDVKAEKEMPLSLSSTPVEKEHAAGNTHDGLKSTLNAIVSKVLKNKGMQNDTSESSQSPEFWVVSVQPKDSDTPTSDILHTPEKSTNKQNVGIKSVPVQNSGGISANFPEDLFPIRTSVRPTTPTTTKARPPTVPTDLFSDAQLIEQNKDDSSIVKGKILAKQNISQPVSPIGGNAMFNMFDAFDTKVEKKHKRPKPTTERKRVRKGTKPVKLISQMINVLDAQQDYLDRLGKDFNSSMG